MGWQMPVPPPGLVDLLKRGGQVPPQTAPGAQPVNPMPGPAPTSPGADALRSAIVPQPAAKPAPAPSDDPAISPTPQAPDLSNSPVTGLYNQMQGTQSQINAIPKPDPAQLKPKLWERIAGGLTAGAVAYKSGPEAGIDVGSNVTNRRWNRASTDYTRQVSPLQQQLESERQQVPAAEAVSKIPQTSWENRMSQHREERETAVGEGRIGHLQATSDLANQRAENLQNQIDHPKQSQPKTADEALSAASSATDPVEKQRLIKLAGDMHRQEVDRVVAARPPKDGDKPASKTQSVGIENRKAQALHKAETNYRAAIDKLGPNPSRDKDEDDATFTARANAFESSKQDALDQLNQDKQSAQDAYESEVTAGGGTATHVDVTAPQAVPTPGNGTSPKSPLVGSRFDPQNPASWKGREKKRVTLEDGSQWELQNGKPVPVRAPTKK